jgi:hypothetical protein
VREQIRFLNRLTAAAAPAEDRPDFPRLVRETKISLLRSIWNADWGDSVALERWARDPSSAVAHASARELYEIR